MKIGITIRKQSVNNKSAFVLYERYIEMIEEYEVILLFPKQSDDIIALCDKFIITGGDDLNPLLYNEENITSYDVNDENDDLDLKILDYAYKNNKTVLGICRGIQSINVYFGGSLKQNHNGHMNTSHKLIEKEKPRIYKKNILLSNSYHHQIINDLGLGLVATYISEDGVVEVVEHQEKNIIGVQYHPEISKDLDDILLYNMLLIN